VYQSSVFPSDKEFLDTVAILKGRSFAPLESVQRTVQAPGRLQK
jgi:hypothetical protein